MQARIAVVDDDAKIRSLIRRCLEPEGFAVDEAGDAARLFDLLDDHRYELITLDLNLPDADGFEIARRLRRETDTAIIMVTGKGDLIDRVVGLELGADDYIAKPFHVREFLARVKAVLRRTADGDQAQSTPSEQGWKVGSLLLFPDRRAILLDGEEIDLTTAEYNILLALVEAHGRALSRDTLIDAIHGRHVATFDRTVDNAIARLRKKLPRGVIKTVRSTGYQVGVPVLAVSERWPL